MDDADLMKLSGASAGTVAIVLLVYRVFKSVLGKKLVSNCCGRKMEVGIDVQQSTPREHQTLEIKNPLHSRDDVAQEHSEQRINRTEQRQDRRDEHPERTLQVPRREEGSTDTQWVCRQVPDDA